MEKFVYYSFKLLAPNRTTESLLLTIRIELAHNTSPARKGWVEVSWEQNPCSL